MKVSFFLSAIVILIIVGLWRPVELSLTKAVHFSPLDESLNSQLALVQAIMYQNNHIILEAIINIT